MLYLIRWGKVECKKGTMKSSWSKLFYILLAVLPIIPLYPERQGDSLRRIKTILPSVSELRTNLTTSPLNTLHQLRELSLNKDFPITDFIQLIPDLEHLLETGNHQEIFMAMSVLYELATDYRMLDFEPQRESIVELLHNKVIWLTQDLDLLAEFSHANEFKTPELILAIEELLNQESRIVIRGSQTGPMLIGGNRELSQEERDFISQIFNTIPFTADLPLQHIKLIIFNSPAKEEQQNSIWAFDDVMIFYTDQFPVDTSQAYYDFFWAVGFGLYPKLPRYKKEVVDRVYAQARENPENFINAEVPVSAQHAFASAFASYLTDSLSLLTSDNQYIREMGEIIFSEFLSPARARGRLFRINNNRIETSEQILSSAQETPILPEDRSKIIWYDAQVIPESPIERSQRNFYSLLQQYELFLKISDEVTKFTFIEFEGEMVAHPSIPPLIEEKFAKLFYPVYQRLYAQYQEAVSPFKDPLPPYQGELEDFRFSREVNRLNDDFYALLARLGAEIGINRDSLYGIILDISERMRRTLYLDTLPVFVRHRKSSEGRNLPYEIVFNLGTSRKLGAGGLQPFERIKKKYSSKYHTYHSIVDIGYNWVYSLGGIKAGSCVAPHGDDFEAEQSYFIRVKLENITIRVGPKEWREAKYKDAIEEIINAMIEQGLL